jgi:type I restriction enzyme M protein
MLFRPERPGYLAFNDAIKNKSDIRSFIETKPPVKQTVDTHYNALNEWWLVARNNFAELERANHGGRKIPDVRNELLTTLKEKLVPIGVLDEFKSAGIFVNWWQQIRYDLKTLVSTGWHHALIPDNYMVTSFFKVDADAIDDLEARINELQSELAEAVETAQEMMAYEPEEDEKVTPTVIKKALKEQIVDLKDSTGPSAKQESDKLKTQDTAIEEIEKKIKAAKANLKIKSDELEFRIRLKRLGVNGFKAESHALIKQVEAQVANLDSNNEIDKKKINALNKDKAALENRIAKTDAVLGVIGGQLTSDEAKYIILAKLCDIASAELERYLNTEKRVLIHGVENLWDKYAVSSQKMEETRKETLGQLYDFLGRLGYLE